MLKNVRFYLDKVNFIDYLYLFAIFEYLCDAGICFLGVTELFPGVDFNYTRLTVISLSHKNLKHIAENELEDTAKTVIILIC